MVIRFALVLSVFVSTGCGLLLDPGQPAIDASSGVDASVMRDATMDDARVVRDAGDPVDPCIARADEELCETDRGLGVCFAERCEPSVCGDAVLDARRGEACDDGNLDPDDGCTLRCEFTCLAATDCPIDDNPCLLPPTCEANRCEVELLADEVICDNGITGSVCEAGFCRAPLCGNGEMNPGEECDDGNLEPNDGCRPDCRFSCAAGDPCGDGNPCTDDVCAEVATGKRCEHTPLVCPVMAGCEPGLCRPFAGGCQYVPADFDADGYGNELCAGGDDCDDSNSAVNPGSLEMCGDGLDNDCDGDADLDRTCFLDRDSDGYGDPPSAVRRCGACEIGEVDRAGDCFDDTSMAGGYANPDQTRPRADSYRAADGSDSWDWNCDGSETPAGPMTVVSSDAACEVAPGGACDVGVIGWLGVFPGCGSTGVLVGCVNGLAAEECIGETSNSEPVECL